MTLAEYYVVKDTFGARSEKGRPWRDQECRERKNNIQEITLELNYITTEKVGEDNVARQPNSRYQVSPKIQFDYASQWRSQLNVCFVGLRFAHLKTWKVKRRKFGERKIKSEESEKSSSHSSTRKFNNIGKFMERTLRTCLDFTSPPKECFVCHPRNIWCVW